MAIGHRVTQRHWLWKTNTPLYSTSMLLYCYTTQFAPSSTLCLIFLNYTDVSIPAAAHTFMSPYTQCKFAPCAGTVWSHEEVELTELKLIELNWSAATCIKVVWVVSAVAGLVGERGWGECWRVVHGWSCSNKVSSFSGCFQPRVVSLCFLRHFCSAGAGADR